MTDLRPLAEEIIARSRRRVQRLAPSLDLPSWLSGPLVELMLRRFSYTSGGGASGALTKESIRRLLADPAQLSKYLRAKADRARRFANELSLLDELGRAPNHQTVQPKLTQPNIIDDEHASARDRQQARNAARAYRPSMATITDSSIVWVDDSFVGARLKR